MALIRIHGAGATGSDTGARALRPEEAQLVFHGSGLELGHWTPRLSGVPVAPQLAYARELLALQRRFGTVLTDHVNARPGRTLAQQVWHEPRQWHDHADAELRVVVGGAAVLHLRGPALPERLSVQLEPGDWFVLPAGVPHRLDLGPRPNLDMLRLYSKPRAAFTQVQTALHERPPAPPVGLGWSFAI